MGLQHPDRRFKSVTRLYIRDNNDIDYICGRCYIFIRKCFAGFEDKAGVNMDFEVNDIIKMKKPHPCGCYEWEVMRVGADFRLKCVGCGHEIMIARRIVEKIQNLLKKYNNWTCHVFFIMVSYIFVIY